MDGDGHQDARKGGDQNASVTPAGADESSGENAKQANRYDGSSAQPAWSSNRVLVWTNLILAVCGIAAAFMVYGQLQAMQGQLRAMEESNRQNREFFEGAERPWLIVTKASIDIAIGEKMRSHFTVKNLGRSPAWIENFRTRIYTTPEPPETQFPPVALLDAVLGPEQTTHNSLEYDLSITALQFANLVTGETILKIDIEPVYRDRFGVRRSEHFCFRYRPGKSMVGCIEAGEEKDP